MYAVYFARLLALVAVLIGIVLLVGALLPRKFRVEASVTIAAPPTEIYAEIEDLKKWLIWSPWSQTVEGVQIQRPDAADGTNAIYWQDPRGDGKLWIDERQPGRAVAYRMTMGRFRDLRGSLVVDGTGPSLVTWTFQGRLPSGPFYGYFRMFFHHEMHRQLNLSLQRLKTLCESP